MPYSARATTHRPHVRPHWWTELMLLVAVYAAYSAGRLLARGDVSTAVDNGLAILRLEKLFLLNAEHPLNRLFTSIPAIGIPADFIYASLHYLVTPVVLVWLFRRRPARYRAARAWLIFSTLLGLVGFTLLPTCPPRLLDAGHGFVDTMALYSSYGWWGTEASAPRGLGGMTNQYAAMPSLHVGWALWCGVLLWKHARTPLVRWLGAVYPLVITVVVMGTANHYFLDAVAGGAVMAAGALLTRPALRAADRIRARVAARGAAGAELRRPGPARSEPMSSGPTRSDPAQPGQEPSDPARSDPARSPRPARVSQTSPPTPMPPPTPLSRGDQPTHSGHSAPIVSGGCETSAGERIPGQRTPDNNSTSSAEGSPATAR